MMSESSFYFFFLYVFRCGNADFISVPNNLCIIHIRDVFCGLPRFVRFKVVLGMKLDKKLMETECFTRSTKQEHFLAKLWWNSWAQTSWDYTEVGIRIPGAMCEAPRYPKVKWKYRTAAEPAYQKLTELVIQAAIQIAVNYRSHHRAIRPRFNESRALRWIDCAAQ